MKTTRRSWIAGITAFVCALLGIKTAAKAVDVRDGKWHHVLISGRCLNSMSTTTDGRTFVDGKEVRDQEHFLELVGKPLIN